MARRRTSIIDDLIELTIKLPWWLGCLLAAVAYLSLHSIASINLSAPEGVNQVGLYAGKQLYITLAMFGQYILPAVFWFGALISFINRKKQQKHFQNVKSHPTPNALLDMTWQQFEGLVTEFFRRKGYSVNHTVGHGPDGGIDIVLSKGKDKYLVQCKQWKAYKVGVQIVRELHGVMAASGAAGGFVVTAGEFTADAKEFAKGLNINLLNGTQLHRMIRDVEKPNPSVENKEHPESKLSPPNCPKCGEAMILRTAKKGTHTGQKFWGCSQFPKCRGTISIADV